MTSTEDCPAEQVPSRRCPLELEYEILEILRDERRALIACSSVCRAWRSRLYPYLFHTIRPSITQWDRDSAAFLNLLQQSPQISQHIRRLRLTQPQNIWFDILSRLLLLEDLGIDASLQQPSNALVNNLASSPLPAVKHLQLRNMIFGANDARTFPRFLLGFPRITTLHLHSVTWSRRGSTMLSARMVLPKLESLTIEYQRYRDHRANDIAEWFLNDNFDTLPRNFSMHMFDAVGLDRCRDLLTSSYTMTNEHLAIFLSTWGVEQVDDYERPHRLQKAMLILPPSNQLTQEILGVLQRFRMHVVKEIEMEVWTKDIESLRMMFEWNELATAIVQSLRRQRNIHPTFTLIHRLSSGQTEIPPEVLAEPIRTCLTMVRGGRNIHFESRASDI
ncbi:hypothetical protein WOLCODRAFT_167588 [Wolfiporia cocos MD-104 SS10]|uniref:F-box domain-containing protein n=1 Tax=Wolfiporia cocos (strain MD-104) TaxID=742152 RepID=A0A2H3JNH3_WOLCO|nr:hypothetical protein WOLCODRAFT_167588 [Wolfiporia cocos MD-104 SS10]